MGTKRQQQLRAPLAAGSVRKMCLHNPSLSLTMPQSESKTPYVTFECYQPLLCMDAVDIYTVSTLASTSKKLSLKKTQKINKPLPSFLSPSDFLAVHATLKQRVKIKEASISACKYLRLFKVCQNTLFMEDPCEQADCMKPSVYSDSGKGDLWAGE